jgi:hypothetical protein
MSHNDKIKDMDAFFEVNPITRQIVNKTPAKIVLMQGDHNSERFTFSLPRYIEGHDMAESAKAYLHYVNPTKQDSGEPPYEMEDLRVDPDDAEKVICSWLISENVTKEQGALSFLIEFKCFEGEVLVYSWHTLPHTGITIGATFDFSGKVATKYADVLHQWEQRLFGLSDEGVQNIETAKADALESIEAEKENAKTEVEATRGSVLDAIDRKGKETLKTIPDDYKALNAKVDETKAESEKSRIVNKSNGTLLTLPNSSEQPFKSMKVFGKTKQFSTTGKNLLPYPYVSSNPVTARGVTFTTNSDGSVTAVGTNTGEGVSQMRLSGAMEFVVGNTYVLSTGTTNPSFSARIEYIAAGETASSYTSKYTHAEGNTIVKIFLDVLTGATVNETIYPIIVEGNTYDGVWEPYTGGIPSPNPNYPQALESVGDSGSVEQVVCGKNLCDYRQAKARNTTTFVTINDDESVTYDGNYYFIIPVTLPRGATCTVSFESPRGTNTRWCFIYDDNTETPNEFSGVSFVTSTEKEVAKLYIYPDIIDASPVKTTTIKNIQITLDSDKPYEPYKTPQSLTIPTPNGLRGIPVSSGGNYTDENGQQWVCDEVDFERGVYVQRVYKYVVTGDEPSWSLCGAGWQSDEKISIRIRRYDCISQSSRIQNCFSSHHIPGKWSWGANGVLNNIGVSTDGIIMSFSYAQLGLTGDETDAEKIQAVRDFCRSENENGSPIIVLYPIEPIETPLSAEEIEAYKALHTNYPVTTIYNNDGAGTEVEYVADTKNYIDNKFAELQAAIISTGGNI